jgi:hypothetical protein
MLFSPRDALNLSDNFKMATKENDSDNMTLSETSEEEENGTI